MRGRGFIFISILAFAILALAACSGPQGASGAVGPAGPAGPEGPQGPEGNQGSQGPAGEALQAASATYVGSQTCKACHTDIAEAFQNSGHAWQLVPVENGIAPKYPFSRVTVPPAGYSWSDISYIIGGYNWKARFIDNNGYIITDAPGSSGNSDFLNQYNLTNDTVGMGFGWVQYHSGETELSYDCGACHTTGFTPGGHQNDLPGISGSWSEPGVQCEACHGPGSLHAGNPRGVRMLIDRDAEMCQKCHQPGQVTDLQIQGGFISHQDGYGDLPQGKHAVLDCVICHDPHSGVVQNLQTDQSATRVPCANCHFQEAQYQNNERHQAINVPCVECHMPLMIQNAWGNTARFTGDVRTHRMAIDVTQVHQFNEDGSLATAQISLDFACRHCHVEGMVTPMTDQALMDAAKGYHDRP